MIGRALALARLALALGRVDRATFHEDGRRPETDTDHTAMLGLLVADLARLPSLRERVDVGRALAFALAHDVVEAYAGDTVSIALSAEARREKAAREAEALERLRRELGAECWLVETIEAYERQDTIEARLVNFADKVAPKLTHALNGGRTLRGLGLDPETASRQHEEQLRRLVERSPDLPELEVLFGEAHAAAIGALRKPTDALARLAAAEEELAAAQAAHRAASERLEAARREQQRAMLAADEVRDVERVVSYLIADRTRTRRLIVTRRTARVIEARPPGCWGPTWTFYPKGKRWVSSTSERLTEESVAALRPLD